MPNMNITNTATKTLINIFTNGTAASVSTLPILANTNTETTIF